MDISRSVKRLALFVVLAIAVILLSKALLGKAVKNLGIEAEKKQQAQAIKNSASLPVSAVAATSASSAASTDALASAPESAPVATASSVTAQ